MNVRVLRLGGNYEETVVRVLLPSAVVFAQTGG